MSLVRKRKNSDDLEDPNKKPSIIIGKLYSIIDNQSIINLPSQSTITIGRSSSCDIKITGLDVSSKHCELQIINVNNTKYINIIDVSSNGLFINDEKLGKGNNNIHNCRILKNGDKLSFATSGGEFIFKYIDLRKSFFDDYILGKRLGSGHYAIVKEAKNKTSGKTVAVKIFHPNKIGGKNNLEEIKLKQEMDLLLSINHPNIVKFVDRYVEPINPYSANTYLILEKMNSGELFQRIINKSKLGISETKEFFKQILSGLQYLHSKNIIHRDIKPENILLDITPRTNSNQIQTGPWDKNELDIKVKIADFGLAKFIGDKFFTNTLCGTPAYVAPEILNNQSNYDKKVDLWSSGVLLYVCLCGFPPFSDELGPPNMKEQILQGKYAFYSPYWDDINDIVLDLISNLLIVDPKERYNVEQTLNHFWFHGNDYESGLSSNDKSDSLKEDESQLTVDSSSPNLKRSLIRSNTQPPTTLKERFESQTQISLIEL
ncbi:unnamed protein product [Candida verbasci]|uniref:DNA damage response protein kinase DUN1 n=1 Tax=Candida verbasci TaxID=1227364 RepID=A0A9W4TWT2_9ASCO|nr:unnamed protein product [Candida verbasci]